MALSVLAAIAILAAAACFFLPIVEYQPVVMDDQQQLVLSPSLATPDHLDRVQQVLAYHGEPHLRLSRTKLLVKFSLARDTDSRWNYTTKAEDFEWLSTHKPPGR